MNGLGRIATVSRPIARSARSTSKWSRPVLADESARTDTGLPEIFTTRLTPLAAIARTAASWCSRIAGPCAEHNSTASTSSSAARTEPSSARSPIRTGVRSPSNPAARCASRTNATGSTPDARSAFSVAPPTVPVAPITRNVLATFTPVLSKILCGEEREPVADIAQRWIYVTREQQRVASYVTPNWARQLT